MQNPATTHIATGGRTWCGAPATITDVTPDVARAKACHAPRRGVQPHCPSCFAQLAERDSTLVASLLRHHGTLGAWAASLVGER